MAIDVYKEWLGIPEGPRPPDHYQLLRLVQFEDAVDKIRANYKKLNAHVRKYATGQYSTQSQELLNELARAMLCLTDVERKREYDEGQGREFEVEKTTTGRPTLGSWLVEQKKISSAQLKEANDHAEKVGLTLRDSLVQLKSVDAATAAQGLAIELGLPYVDLADITPEDDILNKVPRTVVKLHSILPLLIDEGVALIACVDQIDHELEEELRLRIGHPIRCVITTPLAISQGIAKYYAPGVRDESVAAEDVASGKSTKAGKAASKTKTATSKANLTPEEKKQRKQLGAIAFCWSFVLAFVLDWYVVTPRVVDMWTFFFYGVIPAIVGGVVWQTCWKD